MYIKDNRLYDNGVSFEIPSGARITIGPNDEIIFFRDNEFWCIVVYPNLGQFGKKELEKEIANFYKNDKISTLRSEEKTVNDVFMHRVFCNNAAVPDYMRCVCFLNVRREEDGWHHSEIAFDIYDYDPSSDKSNEEYPIIEGFINSVRKEAAEELRFLPACVIEMIRSHGGKKYEEALYETN